MLDRKKIFSAARIPKSKLLLETAKQAAADVVLFRKRQRCFCTTSSSQSKYIDKWYVIPLVLHFTCFACVLALTTTTTTTLNSRPTLTPLCIACVCSFDRFESIAKSSDFYDKHATGSKIRRYFYNVDLQGRLFLGERGEAIRCHPD